MHYAYKFRLYPNADQQERIQHMFGCCRYVYNHYLALRKARYEESGEAMNYYDCAADLTKLKEQKEWLRQADCSALQNTLRDLDGAYKSFFRRLKNGETPGYPRFKLKRSGHCSYRSQRIGTNIKVLEEQGRVQLPKLGLVKCRISRPVEGKILSATVSRNASGKYFVSLCCDRQEVASWVSTSRAAQVQITLQGLTLLETDGSGAACGEKRICANPQYLAKAEKRLKRLRRQVSRKPKDSRRREKARLRAARLHEKVVDQRRDWQQKMSSELLRRYDVLYLSEGLLSGLPQGSGQGHGADRTAAKMLADSAWGEFLRELRYKAQWQGKLLVESCCENGMSGTAAAAAKPTAEAKPKSRRRTARSSQKGRAEGTFSCAAARAELPFAAP